MNYELAQTVGGSIRASVEWKVRLIMGVDKRDTKLKTVRSGTENKEQECPHLPQHSNL